ncbi:MAG: CDP-alcohol phosphatidyltransferase family protein [Deltaproteobacteria bacterium]|nr:MAG: CDP-alcohol phosphatidyltransferase family protein [Deltaproteobacteria bacterium]
MNLPNCLSLLRIILIPFFIILLFRGNYQLAVILLVVGALTDFLDGVLARSLNQITKLGTYLDPIGDKLFLISSFTALTIIRSPDSGNQLLPIWLTALVLSRELIVLLGSLIIFYSINEPDRSVTALSKTATFFQMFTVGFVVLSLAFPGLILIVYKVDFLELFIWLTVIFTVISGYQYVHRGVRMLIAGGNKG